MTKFKQYRTKAPVFDAFPANATVESSLGSTRIKTIQEITELRSTNYAGNTLPTIPYRLTNRGIDIQGLASFISGAIVTNEVVAGSGTSFTLANTPVAGTLTLFGNGIYLTNTVDYTVSASSITILVGSYVAGAVVANYFK